MSGHDGRYHLFFYDGHERKLGHAIGPIPSVGWMVEFESHGQRHELLVSGVKLNVSGDIGADNAPYITTVSVYCQVETDRPMLLASTEMPASALLRHGGTVIHNERIAALGLKDK